MLSVRIPVGGDFFMKMAEKNPDNAAVVEREVKRKKGAIVSKNNFVHEYRTCGCVPRRYQRKREELLAEVENLLAQSAEEQATT